MSLARQQQELLQALWRARHGDAIESIAESALLARAAGQNSWERGLKAYRSQAQALAVRALAAAYPVVAQLLGDENFEPLARSLWQRHPPVRGDLGQWGGKLAAQIEALCELAAQEPYLADVARCEWALHTLATAADARRQPASFALLAERDAATVTLVLSPGVTCIASAFPVASIVAAHLETQPSLEQAGERLRAGIAETALAWRDGVQPRLRQALAGEPAFIAALQENRSLLDSLEAAPGLQFDAWLLLAVQQGLAVAVREL
jgi:hypothetical protein